MGEKPENTRILIAHFTFLINFNDAMSHLLIVKRLELYMDFALYKINILLYVREILMVMDGPGKRRDWKEDRSQDGWTEKRHKPESHGGD